MTEIKCTYYRFRCCDGTYEHNGDICKHHDYGWCGDEYDECCDYASLEPKKINDGMNYVIAIPGQCVHAYKEEIRFAESVRIYELDDDELIMPKRKIPTHRIIYLNIDGECVIDKRSTEEATNGKST